MKCVFTVYYVEQQTYQGKKGEVVQQVLILQDASQGGKLKQFCEFNSPANEPQISEGSLVEVQITEIQSIFSGRPRLRGRILDVQPA